MKVKEVLKILEADGWYIDRTREIVIVSSNIKANQVSWLYLENQVMIFQ